MPRVNRISNMYELPDVPNGPYALPASFSIVVPVNWDVTNMITNPSFENTTIAGAGSSFNWSFTGCAAISMSSTRQYSGVQSMLVTCSTPPSSPRQIFYGSTTPLSLVSGTTYVASMWFLGTQAGIYEDFYVATTAGVRLNGIRFRTTGFWQRVWFAYKETSTASRRLYVSSVDDLGAQPYRDYYVDAFQFEEIPSGQLALPTTYIDGDQISKTTSNTSIVYYWNGTPHGSTSVRVGGNRTGGRVFNLREFGLIPSVVSGLGLVTPENTSLPLGQLDGELFQRTKKNPRSLSIAGRITGRSLVQLEQFLNSISRAVDSDIVTNRQPMILKYQPIDEEEIPIGSEIDIVCTYEGGLEGQRNNLSTEIFTASFNQHSSTAISHEYGKSLGAVDQIASTNYLIKRTRSGTWSNLSTGISGGTTLINAIAKHPNGTVYIGGNFTDAGGSGADYAAIYNPITDTFSVVKSATAFNGEVSAIVINETTGHVFFGGAFTNVDGNASSDGIVDYDPINNTFANMGTGVSAGTAVFALDIGPDGAVYAGGSFLLMGGVANTVKIAKWNGSAWVALGTGANNNDVLSILVLGNSTVYAGGSFTQMGGVANTVRFAYFNLAGWVALGTGANNSVRDIIQSANGTIYLAGSFTTLNGQSIQYLGTWTGDVLGNGRYGTVGSGTSVTNVVRSITFDQNGILYIGGVFINIDGVVYNDGIAKFQGSSFTPMDVILPVGSVNVRKIMIDQSGMMYLGFEASGTTTIPASTTVTNSGSARAYPIIKIYSSPGNQDFRQIINATTGKVIYFDYEMIAGEIAILNLDPLNISFISNINGNVSSKIMIGSDEGNFFLLPGDNTIRVLSGANGNAELRFNIPFSSLSSAVGVI